MPSTLRLHRESNRVARIELTQPDGFPRLSTALLAEFGDVLRHVLADPACPGIVIHGTDKCFAAGAELSEVNSLSSLAALDYARRTQLLFESVSSAPKPIVAAVSGFCLGGGFDLALACHWRIATPQAVFGHPGATLGLLTGWGGTQRLPRLIGRSAALELLLTGRQISAPDALSIGLVDEVAGESQLLARALQHAVSSETLDRRSETD